MLALHFKTKCRGEMEMEEIEDNFVQLAAKRAKEVGSLGSLDPEVSIKY